jgi:aminopeptidase N
VKNLTRDEARERAARVRVATYDVHLDVTGGETHFESTSTVRFTAEAADTFVELDGELLSAQLDRGQVGALEGNRLALTGLGGEHELTIRGRYAYSRTGEGLHRAVDPADGLVYLWAMSFLDDAQRIFACFDQPDLKASVRLTVDAPAGSTVVGNTRGTQDGDRWTFAPTERMSTYGFTVAVGPWHSVHSEHEGPAARLHCRRSLAPYLDADAAELFEVTGQLLELQQAAYGRAYPFGDTYDQLFVPDFNHGAMENPGAVTFTEDFVFRSRVTDDQRRKRAMVVAHEMAHMWFGNLVTMRWWDDLWLNESFAELMGFLTADRATRFEDCGTNSAPPARLTATGPTSCPSTHPVQGDVPDSAAALLNFDGISYAKGASGAAPADGDGGGGRLPDRGARATSSRHAFGNTAFADLLAELETARRAGPGGSGPGCGCRPPGSARCARSVVGRLSGASRSRRCSGRTGSAWGCTTGRGRPGPRAAAGRGGGGVRHRARAGCRGRAGPAAAQRR